MSAKTVETDLDAGVLTTPSGSRGYDMGDHAHITHKVKEDCLSEQAVQDFFSENKLEAHMRHVEGVGSLYTASKWCPTPPPLKDVFFNRLPLDQLSEFDRVWDSRSLGAINVVDQARNRDLLLSLLKKGGEYYLKTVDYDPTVWPGPPHNISHQRVNELYGMSPFVTVHDNLQDRF
ncbi:thiopurine S-methyltransferase-like [Dreissena polymorpha]|uniref:thiopurine S-methyltransferase-like n=1 Tax=Dreissena polymorpha TaxID=45954 RepID=UPI0022649097|nr:thiopurine S-methyltransferase-like [Dreissena polymorpha]